LTLALLVSGCSLLASQPESVEISTKPVEKPELELPAADELRLRNLEWTLITPENVDQIIEQAEASGRPLVFFALTDEGYENLSLNIADIRAFIQQQDSIIAAYENYYEESQKSLEGAVKKQTNN
jgi:PBP1b-binding outer membrane lipoprotein LpoB